MREIKFRALAPDKKGNLKWFDDVITDGQEVWIETKHQGIKHLKEIKALVQYTGLKDKKFYDAKARSIVAMLFWEWRKAIRETNENRLYMPEYDDWSYWYIEAKEKAFVQAHKMLKDTQ